MEKIAVSDEALKIPNSSTKQCGELQTEKFKEAN